MTTLENRPNTALLVIDVQQGAVDGGHQRDEVVANIGSLVEKARRERIPVVWVQHSDEDLVRGSEEWRIVPELAPGDQEPLVEKNYGDSFGRHQGRSPRLSSVRESTCLARRCRLIAEARSPLV